MLWTSSQQTVIDQFIQEIKTIGWFKQAGEPSEKYWVIDTIWEACDTYGHQMSGLVDFENTREKPFFSKKPFDTSPGGITFDEI